MVGGTGVTGVAVAGTDAIGQVGRSGTTAWRRPCRRRRCVRRRPPQSAPRWPSSRTGLGGRRRTCDAPFAALGGFPTPMRTRRKSDEWRCDCTERRPLCPARPPPAFRRTVPGGRSSSSWTITMEEGSAIPQPRRQGAHRRPGVVHVGGRCGERHPAPADRHHRGPGVDALLDPQRCAVPLGQQLDRVHSRIVQAPGELRSGVAQPDDEQVRRCPPVLRPGKGAAQGLALFAARLGRHVFTRLGAGGGLGPLLRFALGGLLLDRDPWRLADGDCCLGVDVGRDAGGQREI